MVTKYWAVLIIIISLIMTPVFSEALGAGQVPPRSSSNPIAEVRQRIETDGTSVSLPFVGCKSGEMAGPPADPPTSAGVEVRLDAKTAGRLALYKTKDSPAIVGPRGWACYGVAGSSGAGISVYSPSSRSGLTRSSDFGIQATLKWGDTAGRFAVAEVIARVFPSERPMLKELILPDLQQYGPVTFGPYPGDRLIYRSKLMVEYETRPRQKGLGTLFTFQPDNDAIRGVAILVANDDSFNLLHLALRLPQDLNDLSPVIIRQFEREK